MSGGRKKLSQKDLQIEQHAEEKIRSSNEDLDEWKRLEKWRPGRRNFP